MLLVVGGNWRSTTSEMVQMERYGAGNASSMIYCMNQFEETSLLYKECPTG